MAAAEPTKGDELRALQRERIREERGVQETIARRVLEGGDVSELRQRRTELRADVEDLAVAIERYESMKEWDAPTPGDTTR